MHRSTVEYRSLSLSSPSPSSSYGSLSPLKNRPPKSVPQDLTPSHSLACGTAGAHAIRESEQKIAALQLQKREIVPGNLCTVFFQPCDSLHTAVFCILVKQKSVRSFEINERQSAAARISFPSAWLTAARNDFTETQPPILLRSPAVSRRRPS